MIGAREPVSPRRLPARVGVQALATGVLALACTEFEPGSDTLESSAIRDLSARNWSCLEQQRAPEGAGLVAAEVAPRVVYTLQFIDLSTGMTYPDVRVRACGIADITCVTPVVDYVQVDARGYVDLPLFEGFSGFLEISSPQILPSLLFLTEPLRPRLGPEFPYGLISIDSLPPLLGLLRVTPAADTGIFASRVFDCAGALAADVSFTGPGVPYFFVGGLPSAEANGTDAQGLGGFVNVPAGPATIDALAPDGRSITGPQSVVIRPGWLSSFFASPPGVVRPSMP